MTGGSGYLLEEGSEILHKNSGVGSHIFHKKSRGRWETKVSNILDQVIYTKLHEKPVNSNIRVQPYLLF